MITVGEPLPIVDKDVRLLRTGLLAEKLVEQGHDVVWWTSTFDHANKRHIFQSDKKYNMTENCCIYMLHSVAYQNNISIARIFNHMGVARKFRRYAAKEPVPDVILCSIPTLELGVEATRYGRMTNVPVVLDIRDMWPDMFVGRIPPRLRWLFKAPLAYMTHQIKLACRRAKGIMGITPGYVQWGLKQAGRGLSDFDADFPLGYSSVPIPADKLLEAARFWQSRGVSKENQELVLCLFSNLVKQLELETVIEAARRLEQTQKKFRFVFCGKGEALDYFKSKAQGCARVDFPGWVNRPQIAALMEIARAGLTPYRSTEDFVISIPNKAIEYISAGLPVISSLKGSLQDLLAEHNAGLTYDNNNSDELFNMLCDLYDHREKLKIMSANAYDLYRERFIGEKVYTDMCRYLEKIATFKYKH